MPKPRLALIGLGRAAKHPLDAFKYFDGVELVAACDRDPARNLPADQSHLPVYRDIAELLKQEPGIDAAVISVATPQHHDVALQVIEAGHHVLLEKPPTVTLEEFDNLCAAADRKGVMVYSTYHAAMGREVVWFKNQYLPTHAEQLGPLTGFAARYYDDAFANGKPKPYKEKRGGCWVDDGINSVSVVCEFAPDIRFAHGERTALPDVPYGDFQSLMHFSLGPGRVGHIATHWALGYDQKTTSLYYGKSGTEILLDHSGQRAVERTAEGERVLETLDDVPRLAAQFVEIYRDFITYHTGERAQKDNRIFSRRCLDLLLQARDNSIVSGRDCSQMPNPLRSYSA